MSHRLETEIANDIGTLAGQLAEFGYEPTGSRYSPRTFGNYWVDFRSGENRLRIVRERGQYSVDGPPKEELRAAGLFRAFDDPAAFERTLLDWLAGR